MKTKKVLIIALFNIMIHGTLPENLTRLEVEKLILQDKLAIKEVFNGIYKTNYWCCPESISGGGSTLSSTEFIRNILPKLCKDLGIKIFVDAPCGDFNWMKEVQLHDIQYIGIDIVPSLIERNNKFFGSECRMFLCRDITSDQLPQADLIMCRDCLAHLSFEDAFKALRAFKKSGAKYLLVTSHTATKDNKDIKTGMSFPYNLQKHPFNFPEPLAVFEEITDHASRNSRKSLALWILDDLEI